MSENPEIVFGEGMMEYLLDLFDWSVNENGYVADSNGELVEATDGRPVTVENVGGVVKQDGEPVPLRDDFVSVCEYVEERRGVES